MSEGRQGRTGDGVRRALDVIIALVAGVALSPILLLTAVLVGRRLGRPILFRQRRAGLAGRTFTLLKFRSLQDLRDEQGNPLPDGDRIDAFGRFLRSTSLDELPQLWNVLRGDMALIGPRPLLPEYVPLYSREQARRHVVKPGLTGWAQVHGRNETSWEERLALDVWYVDHRSARIDLIILWRTVRLVLGRQGVSNTDHVTMERFRGAVTDAPAVTVEGSPGETVRNERRTAEQGA